MTLHRHARHHPARAWAHDLSLGVRIAVVGASGRVRLALIAVGVGMGVAVLLLAASIVNADEARKAREDARILVSDEYGEPRGGDPALLATRSGDEFRGHFIPGIVFESLVAEPPVPPGLDRIPAPGEVYLSPALADLLAAPEGELLRPRFARWTIAGTIGQDGLVDPGELRFYAGADLSSTDSTGAAEWVGIFGVYGFGLAEEPPGAPPGQVLFALGAGLLLLVPVFVLIGAATRIAAAARERRLAALRLIGADANQARRIATGEALAGSILGLLVGAVIFVAVTPLSERVTLFGYGAFSTDIRPPLFGVVVIAVLVPVLAVGAGLVALRHTVAQPLRSSRQLTPQQRRLGWRLAPLVAGAALLAPLAGRGSDDPGALVQLALLAGLLLVGMSVPLLLPWLLQRAVGPLAGGPPSWQLAVRRLQLDSGTPARAAAGVAALLTVAVAVQTLVSTTLAMDGWQSDPDGESVIDVYAADMRPDDPVLADLALVEGVRDAAIYQEALARAGTEQARVVVGDCRALAAFAHIASCGDGDAFVSAGRGLAPGEPMTFERWDPGQPEPTPVADWIVPAGAVPVEIREEAGGDGGVAAGPEQALVFVTPAAAERAVPAEVVSTFARLEVDPADRDAIERVRNTLAPNTGTAAQYRTPADGSPATTELRDALLAGSTIVLVLAAASMLLVSIEQVRERRQQLAALAAAGVPARVLGLAVLWQALLPFAVAAVAATLVGAVLAILYLRTFGLAATIDWAGIGLLTAATALAVVAVAGLTLPSLRAAIRPESLRTE